MAELPKAIVIHYTAGRSAANTVRHFLDPASQVSAHLVIADNGDLTQMVDLRRKAWHAGLSTITLPGGETLRALNTCSIGIELDYDGWLNTLNGGRRARTIDDVVSVHGRFWPLYPQLQVDALVNVINEIRARPQGTEEWVASPCYLTGHEDVAPGRKRDPGPAFPWTEVTERTQLTRLRAST
jgi:N-acetylmuramoyl-L-alanine amidase